MMIYKVAYRWCGHKEDAQDIAQEVCVKLPAAISSFTFDAAFTTWLYRVIINTAQDALRTRMTQRKYETAFTHEQQFEEAPKNQEDHLVATEVMRAISTLPDKIREAVMLVICEGLSHAEAGRALGVSEGTISWRLHEAKTTLKKWME